MIIFKLFLNLINSSVFLLINLITFLIVCILLFFLAPGIGLSKSDRNRSVTPKETINHRVSSAYVPVYKSRSRKNIEVNTCPCLCS